MLPPGHLKCLNKLLILHYITLHCIIYVYGFSLVFCDLHSIYSIMYFTLVQYIATCTVYIHHSQFGTPSLRNCHCHCHSPAQRTTRSRPVLAGSTVRPQNATASLCTSLHLTYQLCVGLQPLPHHGHFQLRQWATWPRPRTLSPRERHPCEYWNAFPAPPRPVHAVFSLPYAV